MADPRLKLLRDNIVPYANFPKAGVVFQDLFGAMRKADVLQALIGLVEDFALSLQGRVDCVVGLDSRGFLFGPCMAAKLNVPFVPVRKKGKLPGECLSASYDLEYGSATVELQRNAFDFCKKEPRVLVVDDLLATGGTLEAACKLVNDLGNGVRVTHAFVIIELGFLKGGDKLRDIALTSLIQFNDE